MKWIRTEKNTCTHWEAQSGVFTLVVEKTPGYDPVYGVFKDQEQLKNAWIVGGTVADCKKAARNFHLSQL
jgi:hypothetical protein